MKKVLNWIFYFLVVVWFVMGTIMLGNYIDQMEAEKLKLETKVRFLKKSVEMYQNKVEVYRRMLKDCNGKSIL